MARNEEAVGVTAEELFNPPERASEDVGEGGQSDDGDDKGGTARDERGRFKSSADAGEQDRPIERSDGGERRDDRIPLPEYLSEREKRQLAERRAEDLDRRLRDIERREREAAKPKREVPDLIADPEAYTDYLREQSTQIADKVRREFQVARIEETFDELNEDPNTRDEFQKALAAIKEARATANSQGFRSPDADRIRKAPNPGKALMRWYRQKEAEREVGGDIGKYRTKVADELLQDEAFLAKAIEKARAKAGAGGRSSATVIDLPSLNRTTGAGADRGGEGQRMSTDELFTPRRRKR